MGKNVCMVNISMKLNNSCGIGQNTENGLNFQQTKLTLQFLMFLLDAPHKSKFLYYLTLTFFYAILALEFLQSHKRMIFLSSLGCDIQCFKRLHKKKRINF